MAALLFALLLAPGIGAEEMTPASLTDLVRDAEWVGVVRVRAIREAKYTHQGVAGVCGYVYSVDAVETVRGSEASSEFFANERSPNEAAMAAVVLHAWTEEERERLRAILARWEAEGQGTSEDHERERCRFETGGVRHSAYPLMVFDEAAAKEFGGRWVRALHGEYWFGRTAKRPTGAAYDVFSWDSVKELLRDTAKGSS